MNPQTTILTKKNRLALIWIFILFIATLEITAQTTVNASGATAETSNGSISYSVGQTNYITSEGSTGLVAQGVQQTYKIISLNADASYTAYPNPTTDSIDLVVNNETSNDLYYSIIDNLGKTLLTNVRITSRSTTISFKELPPAVYFVKVYNVIKLYQTLKIIKY
ncbi:MAG: T9SS type A sorting domain-containing protein [Flavobacteriaceae bacterium]|nr:T9SS type A sorting domain-containing protein [Flavobacteriaceae bacterium]